MYTYVRLTGESREDNACNSSRYSAAAGSRTEYNNRNGAALSADARARTMAISGTMPDPPAMSRASRSDIDRRYNRPPAT